MDTRELRRLIAALEAHLKESGIVADLHLIIHSGVEDLIDGDVAEETTADAHSDRRCG
jgi:hypothetical protein